MCLWSLLFCLSSSTHTLLKGKQVLLFLGVCSHRLSVCVCAGVVQQLLEQLNPADPLACLVALQLLQVGWVAPVAGWDVQALLLTHTSCAV